MLAWLVMFACLAGPAAAHGLLLDAVSDGAELRGKLLYSNGDPAAGEWVEIADLTMPDTPPVTVETHADGAFAARVVAGRRYRITAYGEEGHDAVAEIEAVPGVGSASASPGVRDARLPTWAVVTALIVLAIVPIVIARS